MFWWLIGSGMYISYSSYYGSGGTTTTSLCQFCGVSSIRPFGLEFRPDTLAIGLISVLLGVFGLVRASRRRRAAALAK